MELLKSCQLLFFKSNPWQLLLWSPSFKTNFPICLVSRFIKSISFWGWLLSLNILLLRFIKIVVCFNSYVLLLSSIPLCGRTTVCLILCLLEDILVVSGFWQFWTKQIWASWIVFGDGNYISFISLRYIPRWTTGSYEKRSSGLFTISLILMP